MSKSTASLLAITVTLSLSTLITDVMAKSCGRLEIAGTPTQSDHLICRDQYLLSYSESIKSPEWVLFNVESDINSEGHESVSTDFREDYEVFLASRALPSDYAHTNYVPGPLLPSYLPTGSISSYRDISYLSVHVPMDGAVANGLWAEALSVVATCANQSKNGLYVTTGPIWPKSRPTYIGMMLPVPVGMFIVMLDKTSEYRMQAWVIPNRVMQGRVLRDFEVSVSAIEKPTGLSFFDRVPRDIQRVQKTSKEGFCEYE